MVDEEPVEVRFHVSPPDRIPLPERYSVFINSAGRLSQAGNCRADINLSTRTLPGLVL
jgi:hypothetical protein